MLITYMMGLTTFILCLIVGCRSDYLHSRYSESGESSESFQQNHPSDYYPTGRRSPLRSPERLPVRSSYQTRSRFFNDYNSEPEGSSFIDNQPESPWKSTFESGSVSLKPQVVSEDLPVSYDGASLSDRNPSIHYLRNSPFPLSSSSSSSNFRNPPNTQPEYGLAESSAHSAAKYDGGGDEGDDAEENVDNDNQESKEQNDYSIENTQSSSMEQNSNDKGNSMNWRKHHDDS